MKQPTSSTATTMKLQTESGLDYRTAGNQRLPGFTNTGNGSGHLLVPGGCTCCAGCSCCSCSW
jgi:hypothetical protein